MSVTIKQRRAHTLSLGNSRSFAREDIEADRSPRDKRRTSRPKRAHSPSSSSSSRPSSSSSLDSEVEPRRRRHSM